MKKPNFEWTTIRDAANNVIGPYYRWFVIGVLLLVCMLGWFIVLQKEYYTLRESGIIGYEATIERLQDRQEYLAGLREMEKTYNSLNQEQLRQMEYILPVGFDATATIARMEQFARDAGMNLLSVDVVSGQEVETATNRTTSSTTLSFKNKSIREATIALNLSADGSYEQFKVFLDTLDSFVPVLNLQSISFTPENGSYAIQVKTYYIEREQ